MLPLTVDNKTKAPVQALHWRFGSQSFGQISGGNKQRGNGRITAPWAGIRSHPSGFAASHRADSHCHN